MTLVSKPLQAAAAGDNVYDFDFGGAREIYGWHATNLTRNWQKVVLEIANKPADFIGSTGEPPSYTNMGTFRQISDIGVGEMWTEPLLARMVRIHFEDCTLNDSMRVGIFIGDRSV